MGAAHELASGRHKGADDLRGGGRGLRHLGHVGRLRTRGGCSLLDSRRVGNRPACVMLRTRMARVPRALPTIVRVVCLLALGGGVVVWAQPPGRLTGVVRDTTGSVLPGAPVTVTGAALIAPRTVSADEHGEYVVDALPAGRYLVTAAFRGFEPSTTEVDVGATSASSVGSIGQPTSPKPPAGRFSRS